MLFIKSILIILSVELTQSVNEKVMLNINLNMNNS